MNQLSSKMHTILSRQLLRNSICNSISGYSISNRLKSTSNNHNSQHKQNIQQAALKLDPADRFECPPPTSGNSSSPPPPPPPNDDLTKYLLIGGTAIASIAGLFYYRKFINSSGDEQKISEKKEIQKEEIKKLTRSPENSKDIPKHIPYLLIGGGTASFAAFRAIKSNDAKAKILVVSNETVFPYMRPPLSKEIWFDTDLGLEKARFKQWNGAERSLYYEPEDFYLPIEKLEESKNGGVSVIRGYTVKKLNLNEQKVLLDDDTEITYDKCLLATGSSPKSLSIFDGASPKIKEKIFTYKSVSNFECVKKQVEKAKNIAIIGNGFLGSELACALSHYGKEHNLNVYQVFPESGNMAKVLPKYLSEWTTERIKDVGVNIMPESQIVNVEIFNGNQLKLIFNNGKSLIVDFAIQAIGSRPNTELAESAALELDSNLDGFVVNAELEARSNLYAAGDVACFFDPRLGRRRVEHHDHAVVSGRLAGENMVGLKKPYKHQSMFWSDLGSAIGFEAIGLVDSSLETVAIYAQLDSDKKVSGDDHEKKEEEEESVAEKVDTTTTTTTVQADSEPKTDNYSKGIIFYMKKDRIVGILLWNIFNRISIARKILSSDEKFSDLNEVAKLFDIFEQHHQQEKEKENN